MAPPRVLEGYHASDHLDELIDAEGGFTPGWTTLRHRLQSLTPRDLDRLQGDVRRAVRRSGMADQRRGDRRWRLDPLPLMIDHDTWAEVRAGVAQRAELLGAVYADLYGEQRLLAEGLMPPEVVTGHRGFVRSLAGGLPSDPRPLSIVACDLQRGADGDWRVVADHVQDPAGLGYALQNRRVMAAALPNWFRDVHVHRLSPFVQAIRDALTTAAETTEAPTVVVLAPGPESQAAYEYAALAMDLGFPLVEASDLVVDAGAVWLREVKGRTRVDVIVRCVDAGDLDPLELRESSSSGVPGLLEMVRRSRVKVVNGPGSSVLDGVAPHLPDASEALLSEPLLLGSAGVDALPSTAPIVDRKSIVAAPVTWRVFAVADGAGFRPMAGGLGLIGDDDAEYPGAFRASKDVWVLKASADDSDQGLGDRLSAGPGPAGPAAVPHALADLYGVGRLMAGAEDLVRVSLVLDRWAEDFAERPHSSGGRTLRVLSDALRRVTGREDLDPRALTRGLLSDTTPGGVPQLIVDLIDHARGAQDQLSADFWIAIDEVDNGIHDLLDDEEPDGVAAAGARMLTGLLALDGVVANMVRDPGWHMVRIGQASQRARSVARIADALLLERQGIDIDRGLGQAVLAATESSITHARRYRGHVRAADVVSLVLLDEDNPRSLRFAVGALASHVSRLPGAHGATRPERIVESLRDHLDDIDARSLTTTDGALRPGLRELSLRVADDLSVFDEALAEVYHDSGPKLRLFGAPGEGVT